ncbi:MAG TPA: 3-isopropylmalate dehydratase small subunit [Mycobacteriales bacterium]
MDAFTVHTGTAVPLRRANIDTDQIIPSDFLKRISRTGFEDGLFAGWRGPEFTLDQPQYAGATILLAGPDFGIGSSREHAVWALQDAGFRVVVSARFGDIFRGNALKGGLLPVQLDDVVVQELMGLVEAEPGTDVVVDLEARQLTAAGTSYPFPLEDAARRRLLLGQDDISLTLEHEDAIRAFEQRRSSLLPRVETS